MTHVKLLSFMYFEDRSSQRFKKMGHSQVIHQIFDFLQREAQVILMIQASQEGRPALEGLVTILEARFPRCQEYDLLENMRHRQITGSMIRFIMGFYGFQPGRTKKMTRGSFIQTAIVYYR